MKNKTYSYFQILRIGNIYKINTLIYRMNVICFILILILCILIAFVVKNNIHSYRRGGGISDKIDILRRELVKQVNEPSAQCLNIMKTYKNSIMSYLEGDANLTEKVLTYIILSNAPSGDIYQQAAYSANLIGASMVFGIDNMDILIGKSQILPKTDDLTDYKTIVLNMSENEIIDALKTIANDLEVIGYPDYEHLLRTKATIAKILMYQNKEAQPLLLKIADYIQNEYTCENKKDYDIFVDSVKNQTSAEEYLSVYDDDVLYITIHKGEITRKAANDLTINIAKFKPLNEYLKSIEPFEKNTINLLFELDKSS